MTTTLNTITRDLNDLPTLRRYFGLWLEGSYEGEGHYRSNLKAIGAANERQLRAFIISQFSRFMAFEHQCSVGHAQKCIVKAVDADALAAFTMELMDDALEFYTLHATAAA